MIEQDLLNAIKQLTEAINNLYKVTEEFSKANKANAANLVSIRDSLRRAETERVVY
jgi:hypothetical protein